MKLKLFLSAVQAFVKAGLSIEDAKAKAIAMIGDQTIVDDEGNPIEIDQIQLTPAGGAVAEEGKEEDDEDEEVKAEGDEEEEEDAKAMIADLVRKEYEKLAKAQAKALKIAVKVNRQQGAGNDKFVMPANPRRYGTLKHFRGKRGEYEADQRAYRFGMWCLDRIGKAIPSLAGRFPSAEKFCADQGLSTKIHQTNVNTTGGFLVPEEFSQDIIDLREERGVLRQVARIEPMSSDTKTIPRRTGGLTASYVGEGSAGTESTKSWNRVQLVAKKVMALSRYTAELDEDAVVNIGDDLAGEIAYAFADREDTDGFNGTGISTNGGIVGLRTALGNISSAAGLIDSATSNTWAAIVLTDLEAVVGVLPQYADTPNTVWVCHRAFYYNVMARLVLASGGATALETADGAVTRRPRPLFLGYPVVFSQVFPAASAASTISALLGDFTLGCVLGDRSTLAVDFSEHATIGGENVFERGEIAIRGIGRWDFVAHDLGDGDDAGPIVGITTGS